MSFIDLPIEIKLEISKLSLYAFNSIIKADKSFYVYISNHPKILSLIKDHFTVKIEDDNTIYYKLNNEFHREGDDPAFIQFSKDRMIINQIWYKHGNIHRDKDKPAFIGTTNDGTIEEWYKHGRKHRDGKPAIIITSSKHDNICFWVKNGVIILPNFTY